MAENWRFASNLFMESIEAHPNTGQPYNFRRRWTAGLVGDCPPKAKVTRSNRVGRASFFTTRYADSACNFSSGSFAQVSNWEKCPHALELGSPVHREEVVRARAAARHVS